MFDNLSDEKLRAAHDAAQLLYDNHRELGLDPAAIKLDTLRVDIAVELENRARAGHAGRWRHASRDVIPVEDDEQSAYYAARATLTARYGHLDLTVRPGDPAAGQSCPGQALSVGGRG
jgi:hypothetical protein